MKKRASKKSGKARRRPRDLPASRKAEESVRGFLFSARNTSLATGATRTPFRVGAPPAIDPYRGPLLEF